jgi:hypothetical protein
VDALGEPMKIKIINYRAIANGCTKEIGFAISFEVLSFTCFGQSSSGPGAGVCATESPINLTTSDTLPRHAAIAESPAIDLAFGSPLLYDSVTLPPASFSQVDAGTLLQIFHEESAESHLIERTKPTGASSSRFQTSGRYGAAQADASAKTTTGEVDGALNFNGISDYITVTQNEHFNLHASPFTLEAWVEDNTAASGFSGAFHRIMGWDDGVSDIQMGIGQDTTGTKRLFYVLNSDALETPNQSTTGNAPTRMNHVVATFDGVSTYNMYLNGVNANGGSARGQSAYMGNSTTLFIGQLGAGLTSKYLDGILDEVRISSIVRSPDWIATEYRNQISPSTFYTLGSEQ